MPPPSLHVVVPGDIGTRSGGYEYDRQIVDGLRRRGWSVTLVQLPGAYPFPTQPERRRATVLLAAIPDGALTLVDGLAFGALRDEARLEAERLVLVALVHHPLGLETGLGAAESAQLLASERDALRSARATVVTSPRTIDAVEQLGVLRDRIVVVEPGTEPKPAASGSRDDRTNLLCVASLTPRKGHDTLLDALERLIDLPWRLTCAGGAFGDPQWAASIRARGGSGALAGRVHFAGELSGPALDAAYDEADLFVLPTRYEGYGMVVGEALARGIPVVSTPTGGIAELIGDTAGFVIAPDDPPALAGVIRLFMTDGMIRTRMRQGALRARSRLRGWEAASADMDAALRRLAR